LAARREAAAAAEVRMSTLDVAKSQTLASAGGVADSTIPAPKVLRGMFERPAFTAPERTAEDREQLAQLEAELAAAPSVNVLELRSDADKHAHWKSLDARRGAASSSPTPTSTSGSTGRRRTTSASPSRRRARSTNDSRNDASLDQPRGRRRAYVKGETVTQTAASNIAQLPLPSIAPLRNVLLMRRALDHLMKRNSSLPGIGVFYGDAGLGKSKACAASAAAVGAVYVEVRSFYTRKAFLVAILAEMAIKPADTIAEMVDQICEQLFKSKKPLIIDEGDYLVKRKLIELVRDLYEGSGAAILLVGEERFPIALRKESERLYDRVLEWQPAERTDMEDARKLARLYSPDVEIRDDLLAEILKASRGVARRVAVNIENVRQEAKKAGKDKIDAETWNGKPFYTGDAPVRRTA
jgi:hypothetical protein